MIPTVWAFWFEGADLMGRKSLAQNVPHGTLIGKGYGARWSVRF